MSTEETVAVVQRYFVCLSHDDPAPLDESLASDAVFHEPGRLIEGRAAFVRRYADFRTAFPDLQATVDDVVVGADSAAARWTLTGTHRGAFGPFPPTGNRVTMTGIQIFRLADGVVTEIWGCFDTLGAMQQLGATLSLPGQVAQ